MTNTEVLGTMIGKTAYDSAGEKVGKIGQVYVNDQSGQPEWVTVSTGMFGSRESFAPLYGSSVDGEDLRLAVDKQLIKDAPSVEDDGHLEESESEALYTHYQGYLGHAETTVQPAVEPAAEPAVEGAVSGHNTGHDTSGPNTDDAMTRSEERLHVGTETVGTGRARLRKYIVEETVTTTVPVSHEEVRIEREPITEANAGDALSGAELSEEEHEVILHAERPVVAKETVPVERVRLSTDTVTEDAQVAETVRKEQIDQVETADTQTADTQTADTQTPDTQTPGVDPR